MFEAGNQEVARLLSAALGVQNQYIFRHGFRVRGVPLEGPMEKAGSARKVTHGMQQKPKFTGDCGVVAPAFVATEADIDAMIGVLREALEEL